MREIKFRFWDTKKRIWCGWEISGWINIVKRDDPRQVVTIQPKTDDVISMQDTGLKDKNGKMIFEGDICKLENMPVDQFNLKYGFAICVVEWDEEYANFSFKAKINKTDNPSEGWSMSVHEGFEVIGNIHENPELLSTR